MSSISNWNEKHSKEKAVDGNPSSGWAPKGEDDYPTWIAVDLLSPTRVSRVQIDTRNAEGNARCTRFNNIEIYLSNSTNTSKDGRLDDDSLQCGDRYLGSTIETCQKTDRVDFDCGSDAVGQYVLAQKVDTAPTCTADDLKTPCVANATSGTNIWDIKELYVYESE